MLDPANYDLPTENDTELAGAQKLVAAILSWYAGINNVIGALTAQNVPPVAGFTITTSALAVTVDGSGATDADGTITSQSFDWGDGSTPGLGSTAAHTYTAGGTYTITQTVTDNAGASATLTKQVTVATVVSPPSGGGGGSTNGFTNDDGGTGVTPTLAGFTLFSGSGTDLESQLSAAASKLVLPAGTFAKLKGFTGDANSNGLTNTGGAKLIGSGSAHTIIEQAANSSAGAVAPSSGTNGHNLVRLEGSGILVQDLTLQGTPQQIAYFNAFKLKGTNPTVKRVKVVAGGPGYDKAPPGETFNGPNLFSGSGGSLSDVEVDGAGHGASGFATNTWAGGPTWTRCYAHDNPYSAAWAIWQTTRDSAGYAGHIVDSAADHCRAFFNIERVDGILEIVRFRFGTLQYDSSRVPAGADVVGETNVASGTYGADSFLVRFIDPLDLAGNPLDPSARPIYVSWFSHGYGSTSTPNYYGTKNVQVLVGGVDKTSSYIKWGGKGAG